MKSTEMIIYGLLYTIITFLIEKFWYTPTTWTWFAGIMLAGIIIYIVEKLYKKINMR